ncbi:hypothetical protein SAMN05444274_103170 [Mariniphaga anaerophila]|uniref:Uncharacterized protein n=1 Tax=Mariniphaga anaerophila TaxID=1484053 RepID=A0A1M4XYI5_9BACT|nr:hypothetical protein [Mariniphaga anaerophila]SHE98617.1 hypothetical protein SAMN05444274_103170 [Mariniphaga anaerophila]
MKKLYLLVLIFLGFHAFGQEPLMPLLPEKDSASLAAERQLMYYQMLSGVTPFDEMTAPLQLPDFDFRSAMYGRQNLNFLENSLNFRSFDFSTGSLRLSPFLRNETVFSGSAYQLNNRFTFGGYSFGANSVFTAPFPNQGMNNFDVRGSTLFLQYKVSKNFKIETRVNVTQGPGF